MDSGPPFAGDAVIPDAAMVYDQTRTIRASAVDIFPWVVQLGKARGGWYLPRRWERFLPRSWRASRVVDPAFQGLAVGDRVPDYGPGGEDDYFDVVAIDAPRELVYESVRYGTRFSWAIILHERRVEGNGGGGGGDDEVIDTVVHLRFRGRIAATGLKRRLIIWGGGVLDHITTAPMLAGLAERVEKDHVR